MFKDTDLEKDFKKSLIEIKIEAEKLKEIYDSFFDFNIILTSETGTKSSINRSYIDESNLLLKESTAIINAVFDEMFLKFKKYIVESLSKGHKKELEISSFVFDNEVFLKDIEKLIVDRKKLRVIKNIIYVKDRFYALKYVLKKANSLPVCKKLNKMKLNELQNSQIIFEIINHLGILASNYQDFYNRVQNFEETYLDEIDLDLNFLDSIISTEIVNIEEFIYENKKFKFLLVFNNLSKKSEKINFDKIYIENIISSLIEQSCLDVLAKEKYSSKSDRVIKLNVNALNKEITLECICDGISKKNNTDETSYFNSKNKALVHVKNLLKYVNGELKVIDSSDLLKYKATISLKKK